MTDTATTVTDVTESLAKGLAKDLVVSAATTAAGVAGAVVVLAAVGFVMQKRDARRAKKVVTLEETE